MKQANGMTRRSALARVAAGTASLAAAGSGWPAGATPQASAQAPAAAPLKLKGRIKQAVCRWCYGKLSVEELARESANMGIVGMDLIGPPDWDTVKKYGLTPSMVSASASNTIADGLNNKALHAKFEPEFHEGIDRAAKAGLKNLICFSGNRRGMPDSEGLENCYQFLKKVAPHAEDKGVVLSMELLNSKVNHKDYMCDHTAWGAELARRVASPNFKLLYDIYHMQIMEGDVIRTIRDNIQYIGHFHTGGVPGRNEIDATQELNYPAIMRAIVETGFTGYVAHEFTPRREPLVSLREAVLLCDV
jgi:hydroxypyruvate isomerase